MDSDLLKKIRNELQGFEDRQLLAMLELVLEEAQRRRLLESAEVVESQREHHANRGMLD